MAHCYLCGRQIIETKQQARRRVQTGEWIRRRYPKPRAHEVQTHYGMRIVCRSCAKRLDRQQLRDAALGNLIVFVALAILFALLIVQRLP